MCRTRALAATAALVLALPAAEAHAWPFGRKKEEPKAAAPAAPPPGGMRSMTLDEKPKAPPAPKPASAEERATAARLDPLAQAAFWSNEFGINPRDADAGVRLAAALRAMGKHEQAAGTAEQVLLAAPENVEAMLELARARLASGNGFYALEPLRRAQAVRPNDWRILSLQGLALQQSERMPEARAAWADALRLSPDNPQVLVNVALSHMAEGNAAEAETLLRRAASHRQADARVRQNLALVLGLRGRTAEAEQLLRQDLPPDQVNSNLAWIRARSGAGPRTWGALQSAN